MSPENSRQKINQPSNSQLAFHDNVHTFLQTIAKKKTKQILSLKIGAKTGDTIITYFAIYYYVPKTFFLRKKKT